MLGLIASPIVRYCAAILAVLCVIWYAYSEGKQRGADEVQAKAATENAKALQEANRARDDAIKCALDPECLRRPDSFQRKD